MDEKYINECTNNWELEDSSGDLELYSFFDRVNWKQRYAIKRSGSVVYDFDNEQHGNNLDFFKAVCMCV
ncbi:hypothetical protein ABE068_15585 [Bacillus glycinifermentans]|uniref:Uncharacterized protein n=1 Tax=Bacillus glycinifermentans TaxID=1664069 RepID=A0A0T6BI54_9BACI|nr:hypothetical protein [Bacillus glycinifermentans]KRT87113.1 hypothetical protein AB447_209095 [Bacillus glycinifermentans]MEC0487164.1 hypothetical protein [Bacillus glycinifermentans]